MSVASFFAVLPAAKRGILASVILGIGRAIGETMAVIMVAGNQAVLPDSLTSGVRTIDNQYWLWRWGTLVVFTERLL